jgi:hypothetical protein
MVKLGLLLGLLAWLNVGCGSPRDPVEELRRELTNFPEYSLIVDDLRVEDGFSADYFLRFKILTAKGSKVAGKDTLLYEERVSKEYEVAESIFRRYENYLGMVVASKTLDGRQTDARQAHPPGYQYVGNSQYGQWNSGGFWAFYGQYAFMSHMMGGWGVNRADYGNYRQRHEGGRPYYGPEKNGKSTFGTGGTTTQKSRPAFYARQSQRQIASRQRFGKTVQSQSGRGATQKAGSSWGRGK